MADGNFDRLETVLRMEGEPDRVPFYEHLVDFEMVKAVMEKLGGDGSTSRDMLLDFFWKLGYDYVPVGIDWPLQRTNVVRGEDTAWIPRDERVWVDQKSGTIETWEDFESYEWPEPGIDYTGTIREMAPHIPEGMKIIVHASGGVLENTMWLMGARPFIRALYSDRKLVRSIFDRVGSAILEAFSQAADVDGVGAMCLGDDMGLRTGTMISPGELRHFVFPWHRKICDASHRRDLPFILHACGNLKDVMDDLINYVGIDAKHSFEDAIMPVTRMKSIWGDKVTILGGVDVDVISRREVPFVREYVRGVMEGCLPGGNWALGSGNSIPNYVKVDNYLAMLDEGRRIGSYPS